MSAQSETKVRNVITSIVDAEYPRTTDVKINHIVSTGDNYTSELYEVTIITPDETISLFAKIASLLDEQAATCIVQKEKFVYETLAGIYQKLQKKHGLDESYYKFPKYHMNTSSDGALVVVLENLTTQGYSVINRHISIEWEYAAKCVELIANYHVLSLALRKEQPEEFKKVGESLPLLPNTREFPGLMAGAMDAISEADGKILTRLFGDNKDWRILNEFFTPRKTSVIVHGDFRPSNLMHKKTGKEVHVIPVDYQLGRLGCPASDLINFIVLATDKAFRDIHYQKVVDLYYELLSKAMKKMGLVPEQEYGRKEFDEDMKAKLPNGLCYAAIALPYETADTPVVFMQSVPVPNELFKTRFRDLVEDFKRWGVFQ